MVQPIIFYDNITLGSIIKHVCGRQPLAITVYLLLSHKHVIRNYPMRRPTFIGTFLFGVPSLLFPIGVQINKHFLASLESLYINI